MVFQRRDLRRGAPALRHPAPAESAVPAPKRPLSSSERQAWAKPAGSHPGASPPPVPSAPGVATTSAMVIPDDAETPVPGRRRAGQVSPTPPAPSPSGGRTSPLPAKGKPKQAAPRTSAAAAPHAPSPGAPAVATPTTILRRSGGIQSFLQPTAKPSPSTPLAAPFSTAAVQTGVSVEQFNSLFAELQKITRAFAEQAEANTQLKQQLKTALADSADLRRRLHAAIPKRTRGGDGQATPSSPEPSGSEADMSGADAEPDSRRHSPGRESPLNV